MPVKLRRLSSALSRGRAWVVAALLLLAALTVVLAPRSAWPFAFIVPTPTTVPTPALLALALPQPTPASTPSARATPESSSSDTVGFQSMSESRSTPITATVQAMPRVFLPMLTHADPASVTAFAVTPSGSSVYVPFASAGAPQATLDQSGCLAYPDVRITWYELGTCCNKGPGHLQYGITRSGLPVAWGMAAVQAQVPMLPMGTRFFVADIGPSYQFIVTDTGSETAFGSQWIDLYAPSIEIGLWMERQVSDGRSAVLVCPMP